MKQNQPEIPFTIGVTDSVIKSSTTLATLTLEMTSILRYPLIPFTIPFMTIQARNVKNTPSVNMAQDVVSALEDTDFNTSAIRKYFRR